MAFSKTLFILLIIFVFFALLTAGTVSYAWALFAMLSLTLLIVGSMFMDES